MFILRRALRVGHCRSPAVVVDVEGDNRSECHKGEGGDEKFHVAHSTCSWPAMQMTIAILYLASLAVFLHEMGSAVEMPSCANAAYEAL